MSHASHIARNRRPVPFSHPTVSSIAWSLQLTCPTHALSHLTIFPKRESHHPTHPCPRILVIRTSRPHAHESVATLARHLSPYVHARTRTPRSISVTKPIPGKNNRSLLDHCCMPHDCPHTFSGPYTIDSVQYMYMYMHMYMYMYMYMIYEYRAPINTARL